ncbi:MAG: hypothetical protein ABGX87_12705 [Alcanivorax sp.]
MSTKQKTVKVTLAGPHDHQGRQCKEGDQIDVTPRQKVWLEKIGKLNSPRPGGYQPGETESSKKIGGKDSNKGAEQ